MATTANIFTLKLDNKDFNSQLQQASKFSQDYNSKIANSLLEASRLEQKRVNLLRERATAQEAGDKQAVKSINQQISAVGSLITAETKRIASINQANTYLKKNIDLINEKVKADSAATNAEATNAKKMEDLRSAFVTTYVDSPSQAKHKASIAELNSLKAQGVITEEEYGKAVKKTDEALKQGEPIRDNQFNHMIRMLRWAGTLAAAFYGLKQVWDATIGTGLTTTAQFEQMQIGISALISTNSENITTLGKHVTATEKFAMAQKDAASAIQLLRKANIDTPATLEQLTRGFQSALGPAMGLGFSIKQTVEYSKLMTLAASALTVPMEQLSQEMRSILNGTIDQNSIVANSLGLTNEQIKSHKRQGDVYDFLIAKLSDFNAAGSEVNKSWQGVTSNLSDAWRAFASDAVKSSGIFDGLKSGMSDLTLLLKNQNGELDTYSKYLTEAAILAGTFYGVTLLAKGVQALKEIDFATKVATASQLGFNTAVKLNPWVATAALIATATAGLYEYKSILDDIRGSEAKSAGALAFTKDLGFIAGKPLAQQKSDMEKRSRELFNEQKILVDEYNKSWYEGSSKGFEGKSKEQIKIRIDAITEEQRALKKYQVTLRETAAVQVQDSLKAKPLEKSATDLAKEEKERLKAIRERNTQELSDLTKIHQMYETQGALEQMMNASEDANFAIRLSGLSKLQNLKLEQYDAEAKALADEFIANSRISDLAQRRYQNDITAEKIYKNRIEYANEFLKIEKAQTAEQDKRYKDAAKAAYTIFDQQTAIAQRSMNNLDRGFDWVSAFGKNKIGIAEYQSEIGKLTSEYMSAAMEQSDAESLAKLDNLFESKKDYWKDKLAEIPDIELKMKVTGVDAATNALATIVNSMIDLEKSADKLSTYNAEVTRRKKAGLDTTQDELKLSKLITQNNYEQIATYQGIAGAIAGVFQQGSKEAAAFMIVQQGLALTNAVTGIAMALGSSPWTGIATAAAAAAFIAPMLSQIGVVLGMGGNTTTSDAFSAIAANTGVGSVFGDTSAQSKSIENSLSIMGDLAKPEFQYITQMARSLESIDAKIGGVSSLLLRQGGFAMGEGYQAWDTGSKNNITLSSGLMGAINPISLTDKLLSKIPVLNMVSGLTSGILNSVMGGLFGKTSVSQTMTDSGIYFADALLKNAVETFEGSAYQTISTTVSKKSWFSKSSSTSIATYFAALDSEMERQFSLVLGNLYDTTLLAGGALDTASSEIETNLSDFVVRIGKVSLMGKTGDQIQETLASVFGKIADDIALDVFPLLIPFQKIGEGLFETMTRVAGGMEEAEYYISRLGKSFSDIKYAEIVNTQGDVALEALRQSILALEGTSNGVAQIIQTLNSNASELFDTYQALSSLRISLSAIGAASNSLTSDMLYGAGGVEALQSATSDYISAFMTQMEQTSYSAATMRAEFGKLNMTMPSTNDGFRAMIEGIDTSTAAGQELFGRLILLSKGFSDLSESINASMSSILDDAQKLSDAFESMSSSIQDTINKLLTAGRGDSQLSMIASFWEKRSQADILLSKRGDLTIKEQQTLQSLVGELDSLALSIQGAQVGPTGGITSSLVGQLQDLKASVDLDKAIVQSRILDAAGNTVDVATEGTLTRLVAAVIDRNTLLGIDGSHAGGLAYVPYDGYIAQLHKGERVLTADEANSFGGRSIVSFDTSVLEAINNKIYDRIDKMYAILNDAQLGVRPLYVRS